MSMSSSLSSTSTTIPSFTNAYELADWVKSTFGNGTIHRLQHGIKHVTLLHYPTYRTIKNTITVKEDDQTQYKAPTHPIDTLLLLLCRAAADVIIVSGQVLRDVPDIIFDYRHTDEKYSSLIQEFRHVILKKEKSLPDVCIMTRQNALIPTFASTSTAMSQEQQQLHGHSELHPLLRSASQYNRRIYISNHNVVNEIHSTDSSLKQYVKTVDEDHHISISLGQVIEKLKVIYPSISIESGCHTTLPLYHSMLNGELQGTIDTLFLSTYNGDMRDDHLVDTNDLTEQHGIQAFSSIFLREIFALHGEAVYNDTSNEQYEWRFQRYDRK
jgi:hypothetical protein